MRAYITLTILNGKHAGKTFVCRDHQSYSIGRADDCKIRLPHDEDFRSVSRHHCQLDVEFPHVHVRDCGSNNGTFVNGVRVEAQEPRPWLEMLHLVKTAPELKEGGQLRLGTVVFQVHLVTAPNTALALAQVSAEPDDQRQSVNATGVTGAYLTQVAKKCRGRLVKTSSESGELNWVG